MTRLARLLALAVIAAPALALPAGCAAPGYGQGGGFDVGADYYEPYGNDYGGWGGDYAVGPYREGYGHFRGGGGFEHGRSPAGIPGGGFNHGGGGGFHGGGGGHGR